MGPKSGYGDSVEEELATDEIRSPDEVAIRALALFSVVGLAFGAERPEVTGWLSQHDLWCELTPSEAGFIDTPNPSRKQLVNAGWLSERLIVLLWALEMVDALPPPDEQCDTSIFQDILPPFSATSVTDFIASAQLRTEAELIAMADDVLALHWAARDAKARGGSADPGVDVEVIRERHHAINWIIGHDGAAWDDVTTDS